jgi:hypothetical protein
VDPLVTVHVVAAIVLLALAVVVGVWGLVRARTLGAGEHPRESRAFAQVLQLSHTFVFATGRLGIGLLMADHRSDDPLHVRVYGPFMVLAIIAAYGYRTSNAAANIRIFAVAALIIAALGVRAVVTGA